MMPSEVDVGRCDIVQGFLVAAIVVVAGKAIDLLLELPREVVGLQLDDVFQRAVIALELALGHGMVGRTSGMRDASALEVAL